MPRNLNDEVENFFAVCDYFNITDSLCRKLTLSRLMMLKIKKPKTVNTLIVAPRTNWIVQVDSKSNLPFYHNFVTKETTWNIPDEYQSYLDEYKTYLQHKNNQSDLKKAEEKEAPVLILPEGNARKRRRIKRAFMRANAGKTNLSDAPVEFLSEYIAYSDSSSEDESSDSKRSSQAAAVNEPMEVIPQTPESSTAFIGPQLPLSPPKWESTSLNPDELSKLLFDRFSTFHPECDKLPRLQVAYIQFITRFEDWKAGFLSDARYKEKLEEVSNFLCEYEQHVQFETVDECPPPTYQGESATLNQTEEVLITLATVLTPILFFRIEFVTDYPSMISRFSTPFHDDHLKNARVYALFAFRECDPACNDHRPCMHLDLASVCLALGHVVPCTSRGTAIWSVAVLQIDEDLIYTNLRDRGLRDRSRGISSQ
ncbi:unnamed protein product [Taenia asiatica]|uniref:WW domain-containing protein n=1 Tax=Taenia asiatica TaxID=60517 RepID=A0A158R839_TAEAS|nr:unnamed protein product [Taenia asiatica]